MRSACSTVMPQPRAQPSAALVGLPSASKAADTAGPRFQFLCLVVVSLSSTLSPPNDAAPRTIRFCRMISQLDSILPQRYPQKRLLMFLRALVAALLCRFLLGKFWVVILFLYDCLIYLLKYILLTHFRYGDILFFLLPFIAPFNARKTIERINKPLILTISTFFLGNSLLE